jgi:hypothetical protein
MGAATMWNVYVPGPSRGNGDRSVLASTDIHGMRAFLDGYCRDYPTAAYHKAVSALLQHLDQQP